MGAPEFQPGCLSVYLTPVSTPADQDSSSARVRELLDLIPLDLEYRWRESASWLGGSIPPRPRNPSITWPAIPSCAARAAEARGDWLGAGVPHQANLGRSA